MNRQYRLSRLFPWTLHHSNRDIRHDAEGRRGYLGNACGAHLVRGGVLDGTE